MLVLFAMLSVGLVCDAQQAQPESLVRYHFGDDPDGKLGWADPTYDDSAWPLARDGRWPIPPIYSDGFVWVRVRVPVPSDAAGRLAPCLEYCLDTAMTQDTYTLEWILPYVREGLKRTSNFEFRTYANALFR
jgi:hypothetical protein